MLANFLISILLSVLFIQAYSQDALIGKWRRVNPKLSNQDTTNKKLRYSDLEIRADSTFLIEGDSSTQHSTIPGWHTGDEYNGTWELQSNNRLFLWMEPIERKLYMVYLIIKLTEQELVLRFPSYSKDKKDNITYLRL